MKIAASAVPLRFNDLRLFSKEIAEVRSQIAEVEAISGRECERTRVREPAAEILSEAKDL